MVHGEQAAVPGESDFGSRGRLFRWISLRFAAATKKKQGRNRDKEQQDCRTFSLHRISNLSEASPPARIGDEA
jgi:hypothetical protein